MNLTELERVARAALPYCDDGRWYHGDHDRTFLDGEPYLDVCCDDSREVAVALVPMDCGAVARFIAAANPQAILALLERLREAEGVIDANPSTCSAAAYRAKYPREKA